MAHFLVLVVGENIDAELEQYNEVSEMYCTEVEDEGTDDESVFNPSGRFDWYEVGGRWDGCLLHKDGSKVNQLRKDELDIEGMEQASVENARAMFAAYEPAFRGTELPKRDNYALEGYQQIPVVRRVLDYEQAYRQLGAPYPLSWGLCIHKMFCGGDLAEMEARARKQALLPYALVLDGVWYENGTSWAASATKEWEDKFRELLNEVCDDDLITAVDCHE